MKMGQIKLCHIQVLPLLSGVQRVMLEIIRLLDRERYEVTVICKDEGALTEILWQQGVKVMTLSCLDRNINPIMDLKTFGEFVKIFRKEKFHIVHTHSTKPGFLGRVAAKLCNIPVIIHHVHGFGFHEFSSSIWTSLLLLLEKIAGRGSDRVIFVNDEERELAVRKGIVPPEKAITIYNGVNLKTFNPSKKMLENLLEKNWVYLQIIM